MVTSNTPIPLPRREHQTLRSPPVPGEAVHPDRPTAERVGRQDVADPTRLELLRRHARRLAETHRLAAGPSRARLEANCRGDMQALEDTFAALDRRAESDGLSPAAKWLLENIRLIREQGRMALRDLPRPSTRRLPQVDTGSGGGARIFEVAVEFVRRTDLPLDEATLHEFVEAYQAVAVFTLAELWALPLMLRVALLGSLREAAWRIAEPGTPHAPAAADQRAVIGCIASLQAMESWDWKRLVERHSVVERILQQDPAGAYVRMAFATRDHYRHMVERLARRAHLPEEQLARFAVELAQRGGGEQALAGEGPHRAEAKLRHVGYYLVDRGRPQLEQAAGCRPSWTGRLRHTPLRWYVGAILLVWLACAGAAGGGAWALGIGGMAGLYGKMILFGALAGAAGQFAVSVVNWLCTLLVPPRPTMRLDFSRGIPAEHRTLVAVPAMLTDEGAIRGLLEQLEIRFLANRDDNVLFALLTDFPDAGQPVLPADGRLLRRVQSGVARLNRRYSQGRRRAFYLLHRPRRWNPREGVWMGEERKRGKLAGLNHLLRPETNGPASPADLAVIEGDREQLASVRYVLTLDSDTRLPRDAARELAGCMAHPLNRPVLDPCTRLVTEGHAVLQPRITATVPAAQRSPFSRWFAGDAGIDPYTRQSSDVYQDVFGEGSFIGKGIYDVDAFTAALDGRFPKDRVLSHDLIEGCFARCGMVNDSDLFEGVPFRFLADMSRRHRWIRGDWQIAAWVLPRVPIADGVGPNPLSRLSRWKIFDNLRRSLTPVLFAVFLLSGWAVAPALAAYWLGLAMALVFAPAVLALLPRLVRKPEEKPWRLHFQDEARDGLRSLAAEAVSWCVLPYTVHCHLDAIVRTLYRVHVSRRKLLEWVTACEAERRSEGGVRDHYELMWACTVLSLATATGLAIAAPTALGWAAPALAAWLAGPWIAWRISRPSVARPPLNDAERQRIGRWARLTWHYFEAYPSAQDCWLPPDRVEGGPGGRLTHRTSPTNVAMGLLSDLAACDLGYLSASGLLTRSRRTLDSLLRMERYRGHLFNWYDTRTRQPIEPRFVSTVDSGNLWGALVVLRAGLYELRDRPLVAPRVAEGLRDTVEVLVQLRRSNADATCIEPFDQLLGKLQQYIAGHRQQCRCGEALNMLQQAHRLARAVDRACPAEEPVLKAWTAALVRQVGGAYRDLRRLAFWGCLPLPPAPRPLSRPQQQALQSLRAAMDTLDAACTLRQLPHAADRVQQRILRLLQRTSDETQTTPAWNAFCEALSSLRQAAKRAGQLARRQSRTIDVLANRCDQLSAMDFRFLFHPKQKLLSVGFFTQEHRHDHSSYDLLASETRLASYLAISDGQIPQEHWFALGRMMTLADGRPALLSWTGSMFEYLMPLLLMPLYPGTLLDATVRATVRRQIRYGRRHGAPWGISESCHSVTDASRTYQYQAFGVPELGLQQGLEAHLVISPYASALAAMVDPRQAAANLDHLEQLGCLSPDGFYDALDSTPGRGGPNGRPVVCQVVMAHHSGMTLLALAQVLLGGLMQRRFLAHPSCHAHDLLLQERVPRAVRPVNPQARPRRRRAGTHGGGRSVRPGQRNARAAIS